MQATFSGAVGCRTIEPAPGTLMATVADTLRKGSFANSRGGKGGGSGAERQEGGDKKLDEEIEVLVEHFSNAPPCDELEDAAVGAKKDAVKLKPNKEGVTVGNLAVKNEELYELQRKMLASPKKQRKAIKERVALLDAEIHEMQQQLNLGERGLGKEAVPGKVERRQDSDGQWYSYEEFSEFYGEWTQDKWGAAGE